MQLKTREGKFRPFSHTYEECKVARFREIVFKISSYLPKLCIIIFKKFTLLSARSVIKLWVPEPPREIRIFGDILYRPKDQNELGLAERNFFLFPPFGNPSFVPLAKFEKFA